MALDFGKLNFSTSFNPTSAFPIDARTYFEDYDLALAAAKTAEAAGSSNTVYYIGQIFTVYADGEVAAYQVTGAKDETALIKLASTTASGDLASDVAALQSQVAAVRSDINGIKDGTTVVGKASADADGNVISETYATQTTVSGIDGRLTTAEGEIDTLQTTVGEHTSDISALEANVGTLQTTVGNSGSGLVKDVNDLKSQIGGLSGAMHFVGTSTTDPATGTVTIDGEPYSPASGDVCLYNAKEYVYNGTSWQEFGDESSFVLKTTTVNGQPLSANVTLDAEDVGADPAGAASSAIAALDVSAITVGANQTLASISQTDGIIAATPVAINIEQSQVNGLTAAIAGKANATDVAAIQENITAIEGEIDAIQGAGYQTAAQVNGLIANATIEPSKINGAVANAQYATQAGALVNGISLNVAGTTHTLTEGGEVVINATTLGALTAVPVATNEVLGGIKVGFTTAGTNYAVQLDANNAAFVNVPVPEVALYNGVGAVSITANGANYDVAVAANGILTSMIADGQITTAKIAANAVTEDKIASVSTDAFVQGDNELILDGGTSAN